VDTSHLTKLYREHVADLQTRYARALESAGYDAVVIHAGAPKKRTEFDDAYWPLRVTPHFQHWLPLAEQDCALVVSKDRTPRLVRPRVTSFWEKPPHTETDHWPASFDTVIAADADHAKEHLPHGARVAFVGEDAARGEAWGFAREQHNPTALLAALDALRTTKTAYEVLCLEEANRRAARGHEAVLAAFRAGETSELELHLRYLSATAQDDPETPYKNIVAIGENAATLHHIAYRKQKRAAGSPNDPLSLLLDAGATYQGYCSDITRTWVKGTGATASAFGALVQGAERMQQRLCRQIAIGAPYESLHDDSHRQVAGILREVGVAKMSESALVERGITRAFFPHGLGHSLGLQTHDVGCALVKPRADNPFLRNTSKIAEGQVFTIEPGIYFIEPLLAPLRATEKEIDWKLVDALAELGGVRIEDDVFVTGGDATIRNLTREHLPVGGAPV
jgi:Xaa-Pro dipeptidase